MPLEPSQRLRLGSGASILRFLKNNILKPKQPTEIHSTSISEEAKDRTLAPFTMPGVEVDRVNRDYEAFFKTSAWDSASSKPSEKPERPRSGMAVMSPSSGAEQRDQQSQSRLEKGRPERPARPSIPIHGAPGKPRSKTGGDITAVDEKVKPQQQPSPQAQRRQLPNVPQRKPILPPLPAGNQRPTEVCSECFKLHKTCAHLVM